MEEKNGKIVILNTDFVIKVFSQILQLTHSKKNGWPGQLWFMFDVSQYICRRKNHQRELLQRIFIFQQLMDRKRT